MSFFVEPSKVGDVERDIRGSDSSKHVVEIGCSKEIVEPFFIDVPGWLADDPANYFLPADERFPD